MRRFLLIALVILVGGVTGAEITTFYPGGDAGIFKTGSEPEFRIRLSDKRPEADGTVTVKDYSGKIVSASKMNLKTNVDVTFKLPVPERNGFYTVEAVFGGKPAEASFVSTPLVEKRDPFFATRPCDWSESGIFRAYKILGFGAIQLNAGNALLWFSDPFSAEIARDAMLRSPYFLRVKNLLETNRDFVYYGNIGIDPYSLRGSLKIPQIITELRDQGFYCYPKAYYDCFVLYTKTFQKMAGDKIKFWSFSQEIDSAIHDPDRVSHGGPVELANHLVSAKLGYNTLKKGDPDCRVSLMSSCGRDYHITKPPFLLTKFILNHLDEKFDVIGLDAYNGNYSLRGGRTRVELPENGLRAHLLDARTLSREFGKDGTVTVEERSFHMPEPEKNTPLNGRISRMLADFTARENIIIKSVSSVPFFCYLDYAYKSDQVMWKLFLDSQGKGVRSPFPAAIAYATTARILAFAQPARKSEIRLPYSVYGYLFTKDGKTILPIWHAGEKGGTVQYEVDLPVDGVVTDIEGNDSALGKGGQVLRLTNTPFFLTLPMKPQDVRAFIEKGKFVHMEKVKGEIRLADNGGAHLFLANQLNRPVEVAFDSAKWNLNPYEKRAFPIPRPKGEKNSICVEQESYPVAFVSESLCLQKAAGGMEVDGKLAKYEGIEPIVLTSPKDVYPREATIPERALLLGDGKDIEVKFYAVWNADNLYIAAKVRDRAHMNNNNSENLWRGDSIQLGIVPGNTAWNPEIAGKASIPFNISIALTKDGVRVYDYTKKSSRDWPCSIVRSGLYTNYELAIPWNEIGIPKPREGMALAMNAVFFDLNTPGGTVQHWAGISEGLAGGTDPSKFKTFILGDSEKCTK